MRELQGSIFIAAVLVALQLDLSRSLRIVEENATELASQNARHSGEEVVTGGDVEQASGKHLDQHAAALGQTQGAADAKGSDAQSMAHKDNDRNGRNSVLELQADHAPPAVQGSQPATAKRGERALTQESMGRDKSVAKPQAADMTTASQASNERSKKSEQKATQGSKSEDGTNALVGHSAAEGEDGKNKQNKSRELKEEQTEERKAGNDDRREKQHINVKAAAAPQADDKNSISKLAEDIDKAAAEHIGRKLSEMEATTPDGRKSVEANNKPLLLHKATTPAPPTPTDSLSADSDPRKDGAGSSSKLTAAVGRFKEGAAADVRNDTLLAVPITTQMPASVAALITAASKREATASAAAAAAAATAAVDPAAVAATAVQAANAATSAIPPCSACSSAVPAVPAALQPDAAAASVAAAAAAASALAPSPAVAAGCPCSSAKVQEESAKADVACAEVQKAMAAAKDAQAAATIACQQEAEANKSLAQVKQDAKAKVENFDEGSQEIEAARAKADEMRVAALRAAKEVIEVQGKIEQQRAKAAECTAMQVAVQAAELKVARRKKSAEADKAVEVAKCALRKAKAAAQKLHDDEDNDADAMPGPRVARTEMGKIPWSDHDRGKLPDYRLDGRRRYLAPVDPDLVHDTRRRRGRTEGDGLGNLNAEDCGDHQQTDIVAAAEAIKDILDGDEDDCDDGPVHILLPGHPVLANPLLGRPLSNEDDHDAAVAFQS
eukprot:TRINITY_DN6473_c0_g1_i6.p1 TRINITY_DN6473_c0_g1~~TRINITY_DN6473_c0_g1_i6.p1  ORF type:complete len:727 (+),score=214.01 TRINITY_DN6473_c0_g1_i6:585-2765(+)